MNLIEIDKNINENWGGNPDMTMSRQSARGLQKRYNYSISDKQAMRMTHGNIFGGTAGIIVGASLIRVHPLIGFLVLFLGSIALMRAGKDWQEGKCVEGEYCR